MTHEPSTQAATSPWTSRPAIAAYVALVLLVIVVGVWSARADPSEPPIGASTPPSPGASVNNEGGTPIFTIELTPGWVSTPDPAAESPAQVHVSPNTRAPWVLVGAGQDRSLFSRVDPNTGAWSWSVRSGGRNVIDWAGSTAVFSAPALDGGGSIPEARGKRALAFGVAAPGNRAFGSTPGRAVVADGSAVVLQDRRAITSVTSQGGVSWRARLASGITRAGGYEPSSSSAVFVSAEGGARVTVVDLASGSAETHTLPGSQPVSAWATTEGTLIGSAEPTELALYDAAWDRVWARSAAVKIEDVRDDLVLVSDPVAQTLALLRLADGSTLWTSDPQDAATRSAHLAPSDGSVALVSVERVQPSDEGPSVIAVSRANGEDLWEIGDRRLLGTWRGYALVGEVGGPVITALGVTDGTSFATLNASVSVTPSISEVVGDRLIYLDHTDATARAIELSSGP